MEPKLLILVANRLDPEPRKSKHKMNCRVLPAINLLMKKSDKTLISIDTSKPEIAKAAITNGAQIINDVTGFTDPRMREVAANSDCGLVIMHMAGNPQSMQEKPCYSNVVKEIIEFFANQLKICEDDGIEKERIVLDPGIGFGKTIEHNLELQVYQKFIIPGETNIDRCL